MPRLTAGVRPGGPALAALIRASALCVPLAAGAARAEQAVRLVAQPALAPRLPPGSPQAARINAALAAADARVRTASREVARRLPGKRPAGT